MNNRGRYKLKPLNHCPVCGMDSGTRKIVISNPERYFVLCESCGHKTKKHANVAHATREWNG